MGMLAKIRRMRFRDHLSVREIARRTGLSRNTVRHWLRQDGSTEPQYAARVTSSKLDAYKEQLNTWLQTDSHRAKREWCTAKVLFQLLQAQGYPGGYGRVVTHVRQWREQRAADPRRPGCAAHV